MCTFSYPHWILNSSSRHNILQFTESSDSKALLFQLERDICHFGCLCMWSYLFLTIALIRRTTTWQLRKASEVSHNAQSHVAEAVVSLSRLAWLQSNEILKYWLTLFLNNKNDHSFPYIWSYDIKITKT